MRVQAFAVFGSAIPLGIYAATVVSRLNYLGVRAAGATIALFGGFGASFILAISGMVQWVLSRHNIGANGPATLSWQDLAFMTGGPGCASMLGLLIAGVSAPGSARRGAAQQLAVFLRHYAIVRHGSAGWRSLRQCEEP